MKFYLVILSLLYCVSSFGNEYIHYEEYFATHPEQKKVLNSFKELVSSEATKIKKKQEGRVKIVLVYPGGQLSDYWRRNISALKKRLITSKVKFELRVITTPTGGNTQKVSKQIIDAIKEKPDYLIFTLNIKEHSKLINQIHSYSSTKLILLNITTPLRSWKHRQPFFYVGFDHELGTKVLVEEIKKRMPDGGKYMVLYHSKGYVSKMRGDYAISKLNELKNWKLLSRYYTDGKHSKTKTAMNDFFKRKNEVDLIISCATDISLSASNYKKSKSFQINGWGGGSDELQSLNRENGIDFTIMRMNDDSAIAIAEAIKLDIEGENKSIPQIFSGEMVLITRETPQSELDKFKKRAFRYSDVQE